MKEENTTKASIEVIVVITSTKEVMMKEMESIMKFSSQTMIR